jgi:hypothetical protein
MEEESMKMKLGLYFDPETYRHVRTEYRQSPKTPKSRLATEAKAEFTKGK